MYYRYSLLIVLMLVTIVSYGQTQKKVFTAADYDRAVSKMGIASMRAMQQADIYPEWTSDGKLSYSQTSDSGRINITVDPAKKNNNTIVTKENSNKPNTARRLERRRLGGGGAVSPDGSKEVFIKGWNLWLRDLNTKQERQLTQDGIENFGYATDNAGWKHSDRPIVLWSPDSKKIATYQQDQRHVKDMYLVRTKVGSPELEQWKYPLPGDSAVAKIHRVIIDVTTSQTLRLQIPPDDRRGTFTDDIADGNQLGDNQWSADSKTLAFVSVSRDHKINTFRIADAATGKVNDIFTETVPTQYESGQGMSTFNWRYLPQRNEIIWYSARDGWAHLYLYDSKTGKLKNQITKGSFAVRQIVKVDEKNGRIIFAANGKEPNENPYYVHYYCIDFSGKNLVSLTPESGNHSITLSPDGNYLVDKYSTPVTPPATILKNIQGQLIKELGKVELQTITATGWQAPHIFTVKSDDKQFDLYGVYYTPSNLDSTKKYPVVVYIYPGPQGGSMGNWSFSPYSGDFQSLAELGFIVYRLEGSGNPYRSKAFQDASYGNIAINTLPDQIAGLQQLAAQHPYFDLDRVGIWGHSGGGFATAAAMFKYPDFFKVGISESGNHDNRNYEDEWGERYIGLLKGDNYEKQANQVYAKNLKGKLLIVHGGMDDNVPPYNAYLVIDALVKANKDFDLLIFPNARHGYGEDSYYMMRRRWDYFVKNLLGAEPPKEYKIQP